MAEKQVDFTEQYRALFGSTFGDDIEDKLKELRDSLVDDAGKAESQDKAYGLLKQASGVMLALSHLQGKAVVPKARRKGK